MVDDFYADLSKAVHVCLTRAEIAPFDRVVEKAVNAVAVVLIILCGVDPALGCYRVCPPRRILKAETADLVAELAKSSGSRSAGKSGTNNNHRMTALVGRIDQLHVKAGPVPSRLDRAGRKARVQFHLFT